MPMVKVMLREDERNALFALAKKERRDPRAQAALLIVRGLENASLLKAEPARATNDTQPSPAYEVARGN